MSFLKLHLYLFGVLVVGLLITVPYLNYQGYLTQGDHGRDLYAAQAVIRGEIPYRDFWWDYGPLMPYYYGLFFKIFGTKISSMILGRLVLRLLGGILVYLAMMQIASKPASFWAGCWFMMFQQDFFYTYCHFGGIVTIIAVVLCLLAYVQKNSLPAAWGSLGFIFILGLIKINFGLAALFMSVITVAVCDSLRRIAIDGPKKYFYITAIIVLPLVFLMIYWMLLNGLSMAELRQCLPYADDDQAYLVTPCEAIFRWAQQIFNTMKSNWINIALAIIINVSLLRCGYLLIKNRLPTRRSTFLLSVGLLTLFYIVNAHEFLKSGVWYRIYWSQPLSMMMMFFIIDTASQSVPQRTRQIVFYCLAGILLISWTNTVGNINSFKIKSQFISLPRADVYVANTPTWIATVEETTVYLNKTLKNNELFFALPYDDLYYFLTGKKSPTRQLIFFDYVRIPPTQEKTIIAELEKNHVNYILVSSRAFAKQEQGLGFLGTSYCPLIGKYIHDHFVTIARFGDWTNEPRWAWNHGTCILKRK